MARLRFSAFSNVAGTFNAARTLHRGSADMGFQTLNTHYVAQYADGSYWISSAEGPVTIVDDFPASVVAAVDGQIMHGAVADPVIVGTATDPQGLDQIQSATGIVTDSSFETNYDDTLNIAPSRTGSDFVVAQGASRVIHKAVRKDPLERVDGTGSFFNKTVFDDMIVLVISPTPPADGEISPPMIGPIASIANMSAVTFDGVRSFTLPSLPITVDQAIAWMRVRIASYVQEGDRRRGLSHGIPGTNDYSRDLLKNYVVPAFLHMIHPSTDMAKRTELASYFLTQATDRVAAHDLGLANFAAAGQYGVDQFITAAAAVIAPSVTAYRDACRAMASNISNHSRFVTSNEIGGSASHNYITGAGDASLFNKQPFLPLHEGWPVWADFYDSATSTRYRDTSTGMAFAAVAALGLVDGGWAALFGDRSTWNSSNDKFATIGIADLTFATLGVPCYTDTTNSPPSYAVDIWTAERATMPEGDTALPVQSIPPMQFSFDMVGEGLLTETATGVDVDYTAVGPDASEWTGSTIPITDRRFSLSIGRIQFGTPVSVGATGSIPFTGTQAIKEQRVNAAGSSPWSPNYALQNGTTAPERNIVTGGTIPMGAPVNVELPKIYRQAWTDDGNFPFWEEQTGTWPADRVKMFAGEGVWQDGVDGITYQWKVAENGGSGVAISGATDQMLTRTSSLLSDGSTTRTVYCTVTTDDPLGVSTPVDSNALTMVAASVVSETYDTAPDAADVYGVQGATVSHVSANGTMEIDFGAGNFPGADFVLSGLVKAADYDIAVVVSDFSGSGMFDLVVYDAADNILGTVERITAGTGTFTVSGITATTEIGVRVRRRGTGGSGQTCEVSSVTATPV